MTTYTLFVYWGVRLGTLDPESKTITKVCSDLRYFGDMSANLQMKRGFTLEFESAPEKAQEQASRLLDLFKGVRKDGKEEKVESGFNPVLHDIECELREKGKDKILWEQHQRSQLKKFIAT